MQTLVQTENTSQYVGTTNIQPQPGICPGCGRCNTCGRANEVPYPWAYPTRPYPSPWTNVDGSGTCGSVSTIGNPNVQMINSASNGTIQNIDLSSNP